MTKIAIFSDLHSNYPALIEVMKFINKEKCDLIYHLGDSIAIGPFPKECIDLLLENKVNLIMGNHEEYFVNNIKQNEISCMSDNEFIHQKWTHSKLNEAIKDKICRLPYIINEKINNTKITFLHSQFLNSNSKYKEFLGLRNKQNTELDYIFNSYDSDIICYGHSHMFSDLTSKKRYINPSSVGCHNGSYAKLSIIEVNNKFFNVIHCKIDYNKKLLINEMIKREVPDREFILKCFF